MKVQNKTSGIIEEIPDQMLRYYEKRGYKLVESFHSQDFPKERKITHLLELLSARIQ